MPGATGFNAFMNNWNTQGTVYWDSLPEESKKAWEIIEKSQGGPSKKKSKVTTKDASAPKRPQGSYFKFQTEFRNSQEGKEITSMSEVFKEAGRRWKEMTTEERSKWVAMAKEDSLRYERELAAYKGTSQTEGEDGCSDEGPQEMHEDTDEV